ncbi:MAG: ferritin family protein [Desulfuromonadales bacterium]
MNVFKCLICGDPYVGADRPTNCPACGAHQHLIVRAEDYEPEVLAELTDRSRENLEKALDLEVSNSAFYRGASKVADSIDGHALFSALSRIEAEHASVICNMLEIDKPEELYETGECSPAHKENLVESRKREERAIHFYSRFLEEAKEPRVRQVLESFIEIEKDHLSFSGS